MGLRGSALLATLLIVKLMKVSCRYKTYEVLKKEITDTRVVSVAFMGCNWRLQSVSTGHTFRTPCTWPVPVKQSSTCEELRACGLQES